MTVKELRDQINALPTSADDYEAVIQSSHGDGTLLTVNALTVSDQNHRVLVRYDGE